MHKQNSNMMQVIYFFYHLSKFFSKFRVCSFYDANEAHQIRKHYIFLVHNFEYYNALHDLRSKIIITLGK